MNSLKKVLVIRPRFLGDIILATGLTDVLRRGNPAAEVWFLTEQGYSEVL